MTLPPMPPTKDREPFVDVLGNDLGYAEGDGDWAIDNADAVTWLIDNHVAIRAALDQSVDERIENACQAASETHSSWQARCHAILAALGLNFGEAPSPANDAYREIDPLYRHVRQFVTTQKISCAETIYQTDRVIENAYEFIEGCCKITGYHKHEDEA